MLKTHVENHEKENKWKLSEEEIQRPMHWGKDAQLLQLSGNTN